MYEDEMATEMVKIGWSEAKAIAIQVLTAVGTPPEGAEIQAGLLIEAELRGRPSHGLLRLPRLVERIRNGVLNPTARGYAQWRGAALLDVDGECGLGPVVAYEALDRISARARESTGVAVAAIHNSNHLGMLALYAERVALQGQILIALSTSEALVHPWGGRHAMLGTNPIAIGVPGADQPFVLDMATGLVSMGQIHDHAHQGHALQSGWALDADGNPTTDAEAAKQGAIAPFGQAKGYALGLAFEVLVAALTGSALGRDVQGTLDSTNICNKGDVFIVIEPASGAMAASISAYLDAIRACAPADPAAPVLVPGDRALSRRARSLEQGLSIADELWRRILALDAGVHDRMQIIHS